MRCFFIFSFFLLIFYSCKNRQPLKEKQQELEVGSIDERNIYTANMVGWTVKLPENWNVITKRESYEMSKKGKEAIEKSTGLKINGTSLIELINLKKDAANSFLSTIQHYNEADDGNYSQHNKAIIDVLKSTYKSKKIKADYEEGTANIDDLEFETFAIKIYSDNKTKVILHQKMFSRLINGYDFSITINYNNETDRQTLFKVINSSKFSIRK
jgi:hypothetical protein